MFIYLFIYVIIFLLTVLIPFKKIWGHHSLRGAVGAGVAPLDRAG